MTINANNPTAPMTPAEHGTPVHCCAPLMGADDLAAYLQVPLQTVYAWSSRGLGPTPLKVGRHLRYRREDVAAWLATRAAA